MFASVFVRYLSLTLATAGLVLTADLAQASNITLQGSFTHDDDVQLFDLSVATAGLVDIRSYGYAGGTTSIGTVVASGGFDTILTLFDESGAFLADNDEGTGAAVDPLTGLAADARIAMNLTPGSYFVALTEFDNFSNGNLADGFAETGNPNFTADPTFTTGAPCPSNMFRDISGPGGRCRDGNWAVDFVNIASVAPAAAVPEPTNVALLGAGLIAFALLRNKRRMAFVLATLAGVFTVGLNAQDPDYTNVGDILNGKRNLLTIDDIAVSGWWLNAEEGNYLQSVFTLPTTNSTLGSGTENDNSIGTPGSGKAFPAHMFNLPYQITVVLNSVGTGSLPPILSYFYDSVSAFSSTPVSGTAITTAGAVADFNRDGYDDLIVNCNDGETVVAVAADVNNPNPDIVLGLDPFHYGPVSKLDALADMTVGDFNGDGQPEIAGIVQLPAGLALVIYTVDPNTLVVSKAAQITLNIPGPFPMAAFSIASGRFTPAAHDQIVVAATIAGGAQTILELIDFAPSSLTPQERTASTFGSGFIPPGGLIKVKTGKFGLPANPYDQVMFMFAWTGHSNPAGSRTKYINILSIDPATLAWTQGSFFDFSDQDCAFDMAVGNFDHHQPDPINPGQTQHNFNDQVALLYGSCGTGTKTVGIINVDPATLNLSSASVTNLPSSINNWTYLSLTQSDTQGRSLRLGEPTKITINTLDQPTVIAAAPPMHIDFVKPLDSASDANTTQLMNISGIPGTYYTQYEVDNSGSAQSSHVATTAQGWSVKESVDLKLQYGNPKTSPVSASVDAGFAASQAKKEIDTNGTNNFSSHSFDVSVQTNGYDEVWYTENDFNLWIYPVIGKTVCPAGQPADCPASAQKPLNIQFSAPNPQILASKAGNILAWYQPPWESGNIFSYPANYTQLQAEIPLPLDKLSQDTTFATDSQVETIKANWASGSGTSQSTYSTRTYTEEGSLTESGKINVAGSSAQLTGSVTAGGSQSFGNLDTSQTTMGASTGVGIHKPGAFANPGIYNYSVTPYILGEQKPAQDEDNVQTSTGIDTYGTIRAVFTVDPTATSAGSWWQTMYGSTPDVALNHPYRWVTSKSPITTPVPRNCRPDGDFLTCYSPSIKNPADPATSEFHWMRGFFITDASNPKDATNAGQGPQVEIAYAGDQLSLQTRVYNYSLAAMDPATKVHVRFYVQPWDPSNNLPLGSGTQIGESTLDPIPPFNSAEGAPLNWVFAGTTFDTTNYQGQTLTFWVVVWMQDAGGQLVPDLEGHGLTSIPGPNVTSLADVQEEAYSNNVGFYNSKVVVLPPAGQSSAVSAQPLLATAKSVSDDITPEAVPQVSGPTRTAVGIGKIKVLGEAAVAPAPPIKVSATLEAGSVPADTTTVFFYDGDPKAGGKEFYGERVPYIPAQGSFMVGAPYRAQTCGTHDLFIVVNQGTSSEVVRRAAPIRIRCSAAPRQLLSR